jgi:penicillin-binding protein 2
LLRRLETWDGELVEESGPPEMKTVDVPPEVLEIVTRALTAVVGAPRGTGGRARVPGVDVAGKTGTTQVVSLDRIKDLAPEDVPIRFRDHALFAAYAPAEAPEITVAVVVEHATGGGGRVAAPIAQKVLARFFEKRAERAEAEAAEVGPMPEVEASPVPESGAERPAEHTAREARGVEVAIARD